MPKPARASARPSHSHGESGLIHCCNCASYTPAAMTPPRNGPAPTTRCCDRRFAAGLTRCCGCHKVATAMKRARSARPTKSNRHRAQEIAQRIRELAGLCQARGVPLTVQRRFILHTLLDMGDHPTADEVFAEAKRRLPGISRTTVYRVLDALVKLGAIGKACTPGSAARYDAGTHRHHHLVCTRCDRVMDFDAPSLDLPVLPSVSRLGFQINDYSIHFKGVCEACSRRLASRRGLATRRRGSAGRG